MNDQDEHPLEPRLRRLEVFARLMDSSVPIPGTSYRTGLDGMLGLIPVAGDLISAGLSSYLFAEALTLKVSKRTLARMAFNTGVDTVFGAIPLIGDVFDIGFKANAKNARLIIADVERRMEREKVDGRASALGSLTRRPYADD